MIPLPSIDRLNELFTATESGELRWKERPDMLKRWNVRYAGKLVGWINREGYLVFSLDQSNYVASRVIWTMRRGPIPDGMHIDHIDGDPHNNALSNLRLATPTQNQQNKRASRDSISGFKGVNLHKRSGLWHARITVNGCVKSLGYHKTPELAHAAYAEAAQKYHGEFARAA